VPYLESAAIERTAHELLQRYERWKGETLRPPVDIDDIAENYLGLELAILNLRELFAGKDVLGASLLESNRVFIDQSLEKKPGRFAFTLAHEVAHFHLHRPLLAMKKVTMPRVSFSEERESVGVGCFASRRKQPSEWQADRFAACLLMPAPELVRCARQVLGPRGLVCAGARPRSPALKPRLLRAAHEVKAHGNFSNVSTEAMAYRLLDLGLVSLRSGVVGLR
jgi:Zn-dependent peptidase ImmA (M78 family)